jgi:hypothetical protein
MNLFFFFSRKQDVKKTIYKKHYDEVEDLKQDLELAKIEVKSDLSGKKPLRFFTLFTFLIKIIFKSTRAR